jgi:hypothetical protein
LGPPVHPAENPQSCGICRGAPGANRHLHSELPEGAPGANLNRCLILPIVAKIGHACPICQSWRICRGGINQHRLIFARHPDPAKSSIVMNLSAGGTGQMRQMLDEAIESQLIGDVINNRPPVAKTSCVSHLLWGVVPPDPRTNVNLDALLRGPEAA